MLFDFGWSEILLIGVVALIVIGPKDLPRAMRVAGYWIRKARALSQEFRDSVDEVIREAELEEMRQELKKATEIDLDSALAPTIAAAGSPAEQPGPPELPDLSRPPEAVKEAAAEAAQTPEGAAAAPAPPSPLAVDPGRDPAPKP
jgi:sec-independent protein translocase protein TatB